jgi:alkaline phosphatase
VKRRNQLLALFCLLAFAGLGVLYFQHWVVQKPFGIVLFIGEGLAPSRIAATRAFAGGADNPLAIESLPYSALLKNFSEDFATPDSASAATALATGVKVNNRAIGIDATGKSLRNLFELAKAAGRATGIVTDGRLTDAAVAAFYGHSHTQDGSETLARQLTEQPALDVALGGGDAGFTPAEKGGERNDGRDLLLELRRNGWEVVQTRAELEAVPAWKRAKVFGAFSPTELAYSDDTSARATQPSLGDMVRRAIELLQYNRTGYLLVVDAALMRKAAQDNQGEHTLSETVELDRAVAVARRYVGENSMIIVCGDVAVGGLTMSGAPFRKDHGIALLGLNASGDPWLSWATGPNATTSYGAARFAEPTVSPSPGEDLPLARPPQEPAAFYSKSALYTVEDMIAFGSGDGSESLHGSIDNTAIFAIIRAKL